MQRQLDLLVRVGDLAVTLQHQEAVPREVQHALGVIGPHHALEHLRRPGVELGDLLEHPAPDQLPCGQPLLGEPLC
ncbi:hypothetical protein [Streptomyces sp. NPDC050416]|uniref:hypothetical protein n=1 Tax=Streptomyces sp. NPDC050416 TaxID=3365611 RepID=UPI00379DC327